MSNRNNFTPYLVPFALFALCTYLAPLFKISPAVVYPLKTILVAGSLVYYYKGYKDDIKLTFSPVAVLAGVLVFVLWIAPEGFYPQLGNSEGFDPYEFADGNNAVLLIADRKSVV